MKDGAILKTVAIGAITAMEITAMVCMHVDGAVLASCVGAVCGLVGYEVGKGKVVRVAKIEEA